MDSFTNAKQIIMRDVITAQTTLNIKATIGVQMFACKRRLSSPRQNHVSRFANSHPSQTCG